MALTVRFLRDLKDPLSECWSFVPLEQGLASVEQTAMDAFADAKFYLGATAYQVIDGAGLVLAEVTPPL